MKCAICQEPIETLSSADELEDFMINGKPVHEDCYYGSFIDVGEAQNPIVSGRCGHGASAL